MRTLLAAGTATLLTLILSWNILTAQEPGRIQLHIRGGTWWGDFEDINRNKGLLIGDRLGEEMEPEPFDRGFTWNAGLSYTLTERQRIVLEGAYDYFKASNRTLFTTTTGESRGIQDYPVYRIRNIPVSFSYLFHQSLGPIGLYAGPGIGYQWTRFVERGPTYGLLDHIDEWEYTYSGSTPIFKISGGAILDISRQFAISVPLGYRYARVSEMKLTSSSGAEPEANYLVDSDGKKIPIDLSGFTFGVGLMIRLGGSPVGK